MPKDIQKQLKKVRNKSYLARDFDSFRKELISYARTYFPDKIQDFSEASLGGLFVDMAAFIGDSMSFYLDHQFNELFPSTAIEHVNILRHLREAGVPITTVSPAVGTMKVSIKVPATTVQGESVPDRRFLPIIGLGTTFSSSSGVIYNLIEELDFTKTSPADELLASVEIFVSSVNATGAANPFYYIVSLEGTIVSGEETTEQFIISDIHEPFRQITLSNTDITEIMEVSDANRNKYYEVSSLTQNVVFGGTPNLDDDNHLVETHMEIIPAPYRFLNLVDPSTRLTSIQFGSGDENVLDNDIIPDPSELSLPLYGKKTFPRFSIDPNDILGTQTLGIAPKNTVISVRYRHGGGISHNLAVNSIESINVLNIRFPGKLSASEVEMLRQTIEVTNSSPTGGGTEAPTLEELKAKVPAMKQMQSRIVSAQDLLARVYTMPANYGRVYRASISNNPNNPMAAIMHLICMDSDANLIIAPDALKKNLRKYLNEFRLISDAVDIVDAPVINIGIEFFIVTHPTANKNAVIQGVINNLTELMSLENFQIGQPIINADITNIIINTEGVIALAKQPVVFNLYKDNEDRRYSDYSFDIKSNSRRGLIIPPSGAIFEMKYPDFDIIGHAS